jgi:hypothetical protein
MQRNRQKDVEKYGNRHVTINPVDEISSYDAGRTRPDTFDYIEDD